MRKYVLIFVCSALMLSCVTKQVLRPTINEARVFDAPFNEVWASLVEVLAQKSLPIQAIEKESGLVTTQMVIFVDGLMADEAIRRVAERPKVFLGTWSAGRYSLNIFVKALGENKTSIKITSHVEAFEDNVSKKWYICYSKGVIENSIFDDLRSKYDVKSELKFKTSLKKDKL